MAAVFFTIFSAGAIFSSLYLGTANNSDEAFKLYSDKVGQILDKKIIESCSNKLPEYSAKENGSYTFKCDIGPTTGGRKSRKFRKSRRNRKSRKSRK